jgi:hypothetical protein
LLRRWIALTVPARYARRDESFRNLAKTSTQALPPTPAHDHEGDMTTFDEREKGYEQQFAHDQDLRFKAIARRNKLLGLWAAAKLGIVGPAADAYSKDVVMAEFEAGGDEDVFRKLRKDFDAKGVAQSDQDIRKAMQDLLAQAVQQIKAGT